MDSGTSAKCKAADNREISTYHGADPAPPSWCPALALSSQAAEIERLTKERDEARQVYCMDRDASVAHLIRERRAAEAKLEEARKALEPTDEMVIAFMREFEKWSLILRYREARKWHATDIAGVRHGLREALALLSPEAKEKGNG